MLHVYFIKLYYFIKVLKNILTAFSMVQSFRTLCVYILSPFRLTLKSFEAFNFGTFLHCIDNADSFGMKLKALIEKYSLYYMLVQIVYIEYVVYIRILYVI